MNDHKFKDGTQSEIFCPRCVAPDKLVVRTNKAGRQYLGCVRWPRCRWTEDVPEAWRMRVSGQKRLI